MAQYINKVIVNGETKIDLTSDSVEPSKLLSGTTAHDKSGAPITGACTFDADTKDATAVESEILLGKTAYVKGQKKTGTMPNNGSVSGEISDLTPYTVPAGYHDGAGKVKIADAEQAKLIANNIREGITILGVEGTMSGTEDVTAQAKTVTPSFSQQEVMPDTDSGYNYLSSVTVKPIPVNETEGQHGGLTLTIG